ncbi:secretin N-terminal domain-containing protein [Candidatus Protochlamydia phocaeensis]|uniref:secretin N-terminal domain-containing protein n=1 Tax=Candidatus Protochlamydia phocaeensis TaxID=1414722 RepID=UPI000839A328|nr:secretin N-terminal domain-containing protein [Candidatus Protochlamydia phocaeensis]
MKKITLSPQFLLKCWLLSMACRSVESLSAFDASSEEQFPRSIEDNWSATEFEQNLNSYSYQPEFYDTSHEEYNPYGSSSFDQASYSSQNSSFAPSYPNSGSESLQRGFYYQGDSSPYSYRENSSYSSPTPSSQEDYYSDWSQEPSYSNQENSLYYSEQNFSQPSLLSQDSPFISWQDGSNNQAPATQERAESSYLNNDNGSLQTSSYYQGYSSYSSQRDTHLEPLYSTPNSSVENQSSFYSSQEENSSYETPIPQIETPFYQNNENLSLNETSLKREMFQDERSLPEPARDKVSEQEPAIPLQSPSNQLNSHPSSSDISSQGQSYPFEEKRFDWNTTQTEPPVEQQKKWITPVPVTTDFTHPASQSEVKSSEANSLDTKLTGKAGEEAQIKSASELKDDQKSAEDLKTEEKKLNLNQGKGNIKIIKKSPAPSTDKVPLPSGDKALNIVGKKTITAPEVGLVDPIPSSSSKSIIAETVVDKGSLKQVPLSDKTILEPKQSSGSTVASKALDKQSLSLAIEKEEEQKSDSVVAQTALPEAPLLPPRAPIPAPAHPARAAARPTIVTPTDPDPHPADAASPQGPTINFNNVAMIEYIRFISRISNRNFIFDEEDLQFNVTIISEEPTSIDNLMAALLQELRIRDLLIIEQGNNIIIHRNPRIRAPARIVVDGTEPSSPRDSELVTRVFRLNTLDPGKASEIIKPLLSDDALVEILRDSNNLIITDIAVNVNKIAQLIASLDAPNSGVTVGQYVVRNAFVTSLVDLAAKILQPIAQGNPFVLVPHSATNSIYIVSNPFIVEKALAILENLDINEGRTKILSLEKLRLQQEAGPGGAMAPGTLGGGAGGAGGPGAGPGGAGPGVGPGGLGGLGGPGGPGAGGVPGGPGGAGMIGIPNVPGGAGGINVPGTPTYNPALPSSYPIGPTTQAPGTLNIPGSPTYNPSLPPSLPLGPGGIGVEGRQAPPSAMFEEGREFIPGGISVAPRWNQELPAGHIERTLFFLYKLKYRRGDQIEIALRRIADSLAASGTANADLVAAILSSQWLEASNSLIFTGTVSALERIKELILEIDTPLRQVFIEMLILDTSIQDSLTYSVDWGQRFGGGNTAGGEAFVSGNTTLASNLDSGTNAGAAATTATNTAQTFTGPTSTGLFGAQGFTLGVIGRHLTHNGLHFNTIGALVHALHTDTKVNIIMNPKIVTEDNNTAEVFVGSTDRYKTQSIANDLGTVITNNFQFIDVGTTLRVTPLIGNNDIITLDIIEEVTNDSGAANATSANAAATDVNLVPVLSKTRTTTRIHVPNGFFVILSGMISGTESRTLNQIPCLGGIPLIGGVSKQKGNADSKRNLMIFIRPLIVDTEEDLENLTKRQQDVFQEKCKFRRSWNYEIDEALDFMSIRPTDPDEIGCRIK